LPAKQHGLFGFTLAEGYSGTADANHDGRIEVSELFAMLTQSMAAAAAQIKHPQTPQLFLPDTKPPRLTEEAKLAIRKLAGFVSQDRVDAVQANAAYAAAKKLAGEELEPKLLMGLLYMKARNKPSAERHWNDLSAAQPELLLPLEGLAWLDFDKRTPAAGLGVLLRLATAIHKPADDAGDFPPDAARALVFAGQLREFAAASAEDQEHLPQDALDKLDAAVAALGDPAVQLYEQGRKTSRKVADDFDAKLADASADDVTKSKLRIEHRLLGRYVPFPYEASAKSILDGLDKEK
jgi:hypothetical protein